MTLSAATCHYVPIGINHTVHALFHRKTSQHRYEYRLTPVITIPLKYDYMDTGRSRQVPLGYFSGTDAINSLNRLRKTYPVWSIRTSSGGPLRFEVGYTVQGIVPLRVPLSY